MRQLKVPKVMLWHYKCECNATYKHYSKVLSQKYLLMYCMFIKMLLKFCIHFLHLSIMQICVDKNIYTIDHAYYFFKFNLTKNDEKFPVPRQVPISSAHMCLSAVFWLSIVDQLALPLRPHIDFRRYQLRQRTHFISRIPCHDVKVVAWANQLIVFIL